MGKCKNMPKGNGSISLGFKLTDTKQLYIDRFYNQFQSKYEVKGDCVNKESINYLFRRFWSDGQVAAYVIPNTDVLGLAQFSTVKWNIWNYPAKIQLIPRMEASRALIPAKILTVGKDCVIGRIRPDGKPIQLIADYYAGKLSDIDKAIEMALIVQRTPYLISSGPEDRNRLLDYFRRVLNDEVILSINSADQNSLNVLNFNVQYILDKLEVEKTEVLHQALTEFGFDACGRDNERTLVAEVSLDSVETQDINDMYKQEIEYFAKDIKDILGLDIRFIPRTKEIKLLGDHINKSEEDAKKYDAGKDAE